MSGLFFDPSRNNLGNLPWTQPGGGGGGLRSQSGASSAQEEQIRLNTQQDAQGQAAGTRLAQLLDFRQKTARPGDDQAAFADVDADIADARSTLTGLLTPKDALARTDPPAPMGPLKRAQLEAAQVENKDKLQRNTFKGRRASYADVSAYLKAEGIEKGTDMTPAQAAKYGNLMGKADSRYNAKVGDRMAHPWEMMKRGEGGAAMDPAEFLETQASNDRAEAAYEPPEQEKRGAPGEKALAAQVASDMGFTLDDQGILGAQAKNQEEFNQRLNDKIAERNRRDLKKSALEGGAGISRPVKVKTDLNTRYRALNDTLADMADLEAADPDLFGLVGKGKGIIAEGIDIAWPGGSKWGTEFIRKQQGLYTKGIRIAAKLLYGEAGKQLSDPERVWHMLAIGDPQGWSHARYTAAIGKIKDLAEEEISRIEISLAEKLHIDVPAARRRLDEAREQRESEGTTLSDEALSRTYTRFNLNAADHRHRDAAGRLTGEVTRVPAGHMWNPIKGKIEKIPEGALARAKDNITQANRPLPDPSTPIVTQQDIEPANAADTGAGDQADAIRNMSPDERRKRIKQLQDKIAGKK